MKHGRREPLSTHSSDGNAQLYGGFILYMYNRRLRKKDPAPHNRPFPSYLVPLLQSVSACKTFVMKGTFICMKMNLWGELSFV